MNIDNQEAVYNLEYNSERTHLIIPEYGRHLQNLINKVTVIENDEERNKAARYVIDVMGTLNPHLRDVPDFQHKLWDQLFIMSDFKLKVDSPYPIPSRDVLNQKPERIAYPQNFPKYRFYGNNIMNMIEAANKWEEGELKKALIIVIANHMKKSYLSWNKDTVEDAIIFNHLYELSGGKINLTNSEEELSTSYDLIKVNKKQSNKSNFSNNAKSGVTKKNKLVKNISNLKVKNRKA